MTDQRIRVGTAPGYDVHVRRGALDELPDLLASAAPAAAYALIAPHALAPTHAARAARTLREAGMHVELLAFDDAEASKTRGTWADLTDRMIAAGMGRDACVVALGGGVTGDIAGFVAATYMRGIPFVQVPTTLLAMIDASIGGKTGVDTDAGKNLVGAFISPALVVADPDVLSSLPPQQLRSGLAEAVKHGAILERAYFDWIAQHADAILALDSDAMQSLIARSVEIKAGIVAADPLESGRRAILNFGHTIGHALELLSRFTMSHGAAVAAGMCAEAVLGEACGVTERGTADSLRRLLMRLDLPVGIPFDATDIAGALATDKKVRANRPRFALLRRIGECAPAADGGWTHTLEAGLLEDVLVRLAAADAV